MKKFGLLIPLSLLLICPESWTKEVSAHPRKLNLSISNSVPPYNMLAEKVDGLPGIQIEIVTKIMARIGRQVDWQTMTNNRAIHELNKDKLDGALNISEFISGKYLNTKSIVDFSNCLIGNKDASARYKDFNSFYEALKTDKKIQLTGFQGASIVFSSYLPGLNTLSNYNEIPHQKSLVATLLMGRTNFILSDFLVYRYYAQELKRSSKIKERPEEFTCLAIIPSAPRVITLKDEALQKSFDEEFQKMVESGEREKIISKYQLFLSKFLDNGNIYKQSKYTQDESFALIYK